MNVATIGSFLTVIESRFDFVNKKSDEFTGYNPNPEFYQKIVDADLLNEVFSEMFILPLGELATGGELKLDIPWHCGYVFSYEGSAFIIDEELQSYCKLTFSELLRNKAHFISLLTTAIDLIKFGYQKGHQQGKVDNTLQIRSMLNKLS